MNGVNWAIICATRSASSNCAEGSLGTGVGLGIKATGVGFGLGALATGANYEKEKWKKIIDIREIIVLLYRFNLYLIRFKMISK